MSRYDGLIIPRSYNEYINKTDPVAMSQALQLNGVMDAAPTANSNKPAKSGGIYNLFGYYQKLYATGYISAASTVRIKCVSGRQVFRIYARAGETVFFYQGTETVAIRERAGYRKISLAWDTDYLYISFSSYAENCFIESFYGYTDFEIIKEIPSGATAITITE
jgi:hypothetical protein